MPSSVDVQVANQARCVHILECKRQINSWKSKLEVLEAEQENCIKLARLRLDVQSTWRSLSRKERVEKKFILAALESTNELPTMLQDFPNSSFPPHIRFDRDVLLARSARPDFGRTDERLFIPPKLRGDKEVILSILPKHPQVIECMTCELRDDEDIMNALLANATLPSHFLQHFSERIRSNQSLMLQVVQHPQGLQALAFLSSELRNDKDFFLQVIQCGNHRAETQVLRYASHRLRVDREVVYQAVCKSGLNLKHAGYSLRRDAGVVLAATAENGTAFRYCLPGSVKDDLLGNRALVLEVVRRAPNNVLRNCVHRFQQDREILLQAAMHGLEWSAIPDAFSRDTEFLMEVLENCPQRYMDLPEETRETFEIALHVVQVVGASDDVILEATEQCPALLANRTAMMAIAKNLWTEVLQETLQFSPIAIREDKELMLEAVKSDPIAFEYCTDELQLDREVVMAAIPTSLYLVTDAFQSENPDIIVRAIEKTDRGDLWTTYDDVCDELWMNRDVALAWLSKGGDWLSDDFLEDFCDDEELFLTVVHTNWTEFDYASDALKNNKDFLLRALALDGRIIRDISEDLRYDYDLALTAFSNDRRALQFYSAGADFEFMVSFTQRVRARLEEHAIFRKEILGNISPGPTTKNDRCLLSMLNQGPDTVAFYERTLASLLGLPEGDELRELQEASKNLLAWGF